MRLSFQKEICISSIGLPVPIWSKLFELGDKNKPGDIEFPLFAFLKVYHPKINISNLYSFLFEQLKTFEKEFW